MTRLSDICRLEGCKRPHRRNFSHIVDNHRYDFCTEAHQLEHIQQCRLRQFATRRAELERREYGARH